MGHFATTVLVPLARVSLGYAERLLADIPASEFARTPAGVRTNHPAFVYGHLAIYPDRLLEFMGRTDLARPNPRFLDLFAAGKECIDDADGSVYPAMDEVVRVFRERYEAVLTPLAEAPESAFERANPSERMRDRLPTVAAMAAFLLGSHMMMHLGQVSAWRRCKGLPPVM
jgi:hypothetical protein